MFSNYQFMKKFKAIIADFFQSFQPSKNFE